MTEPNKVTDNEVIDMDDESKNVEDVEIDEESDAEPDSEIDDDESDDVEEVDTPKE